jgi:hypothetical protein
MVWDRAMRSWFYEGLLLERWYKFDIIISDTWKFASFEALGGYLLFPHIPIDQQAMTAPHMLIF